VKVLVVKLGYNEKNWVRLTFLLQETTYTGLQRAAPAVCLLRLSQRERIGNMVEEVRKRCHVSLIEMITIGSGQQVSIHPTIKILVIQACVVEPPSRSCPASLSHCIMRQERSCILQPDFPRA